MSEVGQSFIISILPILLGLSLFLLFTLFNPAGKKHVITKSSTILKETTNPILPHPTSLSKNYLYDQLILRGVFVKKEDAIQKVAFSKFGMLQIGGLEHLFTKPPKTLELISNSSNYDTLSRLSNTNSAQFGALLPYLLNSSLKLVVL